MGLIQRALKGGSLLARRGKKMGAKRYEQDVLLPVGLPGNGGWRVFFHCGNTKFFTW